MSFKKTASCFLALFFNVCAYASITYAPIICDHPTKLVLDLPNLEDANTESLPLHFRSTEFPNGAHIIDATGLKNLHLSGGGQFSKQGLHAIQKKIPGLAYVIDLRREPHVFLNDGIPISIFGVPHDWSNTCPKEKFLAQKNMVIFLRAHQGQLLDFGINDDATNAPQKIFSLPIHQIQTEAELTQAAGVKYEHIGVIDHEAPSTEEINAFVNLVKTIPPGTSIYLHCHAGQGRTSTFMMMYDIIRNAKQVSFNNIAQRQIALGGVDLLNISQFDSYNDIYKKGPAIIRAQFLKDFYNYCKNNQDDFKTRWEDYKHSAKSSTG